MPEMSPADVPDEWLQAAFDTIGHSNGADGDEQVRHILAAVLPLHEQQVRERIAGELCGLPVVQHLGIARSNATRYVADVAEAALRWAVMVVQCPELIPEKAGDEAKLKHSAWPSGLPKLRKHGPTGRSNV